MKDIKDVLENDPLGILGGSDDDIFDLSWLSSLESKKGRKAPEFIATRKPCGNFSEYEPMFEKVRYDLSKGIKRTRHFDNKGRKLVAGGFYISGGIIVYLESIKDGRTSCIFDNATCSSMKYDSLARALYNDGMIIK